MRRSERRVRSWLRMNAGGAPNTCKSNGRTHLGGRGSGERLSNTWATCPPPRNSLAKAGLMPDTPPSPAWGRRESPDGGGWARGLLASWRGNGPPRRLWVAGLRDRPARLGLRHGPDSYGRQQWGILRNGRKPDAATPRAGGRPSGRKPLSAGTRPQGDGTCRRSPG